MSAYTQMRVKGRDDLSRCRYFLRASSDIPRCMFEPIRISASPSHLRGKRVGIGFYQMSGAVWAAGVDG